MNDVLNNQHPIICQCFFLASAQIHGQQCFLSFKISLTHLISAITLAPYVYIAFAQLTTVL